MAAFGRGKFGADAFGSGGSEELLTEEVSVLESLSIGDGVSLSENVGVLEDLDVQDAVLLSESVSIIELLSTGVFEIANIGGHLVRVSFPTELHYDLLNEASFVLEPARHLSSPGAPLSVSAVQPLVDVIQEGDDGAVVPESLGSGVYDLDNGVSTHFRISGTLDPNGNLGDFIRVKTGQNVGIYQIVSVAAPGPGAVAVLDRPLALVDSASGAQSIQSAPTLSDLNSAVVPVDLQLVSFTGALYTFRVKHPAVTPGNPISRLYRLARLARPGSSAPALNGGGAEGAFVPEDLFSLTSVTLVDYRTFQVQDSGAPALRGASLQGIVDRFSTVVQLTPSVEWEHTTGVKALDMLTSKLTNGGAYSLKAPLLYRKWPKTSIALEGVFRAQGVPQPRVLSASASAEGYVTVAFDEPMQQDPENLGKPADYVFTGPTEVSVARVYSVDEQSVTLVTAGLGAGAYTLSVSANTPKDLAGNPIDPTFNEAIFTASVPLLSRSLFTDKGPITKPALTLQSGTGGELDNFEAVTLPGAVFTLDDIGKRLRLTGSASNDGVYEVLSIVDTNEARVRARFILPDASNGAIDWELFDPRTGQIADDPSDVVVRVNGVPVVPQAVVGLRGQIILPDDPVPTGDVEVDYSWIPNPRVEIRRLNSLEFRLNAWNRDPGGPTPSQHHYRFNNVLVTPSDYDPDNVNAAQPQPLVRELQYRAYERAYTAVFNDPTKLLFNTPIHRIAYPSASRVLSETAVLYDALTLPEADPINPWARKGLGNAVAAAGALLVVDNSAATFPTGEPLFWTRTIDLSFDHVFSVAWRFSVDTVTVSEGVWTGIAAGYSNTGVCYAVGYIDDAGVKKIGFLKRGAGDAFGTTGAWIGGLDSGGTPTNAPAAFDWSVVHSYRLFTDRGGVTRLYVDGDIVETLRIGPDEAPFLEELNGPFTEIQGVFFGSLSRPAQTVSTWEFYQYLIQPLNAVQLSPSSFVSYEGSDLPEVDSAPWTLVGFHGTSAVFGASNLLLDSTSATDAATSAAAGLVGGDFRGYVKIEPLLSAASQVAVDAQVQLLTHTHGIDPDGLMLAVDDGTRLLQLSFFPGESAPKLSYGGRSLPTEFSPYVWSTLGTQPVAMRGRILRISDGVTSNGRVYSIDDNSPIGSPSRVVSAALDYILEFRCQVISRVADGSGFSGAFGQVYDGARLVGLLLQEVSGTRYVALHSDGVALAAFAFEWNDARPHTYRLRKNTGGNLVSVFVDGTFLGSFAYSGFAVPPPVPPPSVVGQISFGSSTPASAQAMSVVDWHYCNAWRVDASPRRYAGLWKGYERDSLTGYHLPLKASGVSAAVVANTLEDPLANFVAANVQIGDTLVVDSGLNKGVYEIASVAATVLTITNIWPAQPSVLSYRVAREMDWSVPHKYRLARDSTGTVSVYFDGETAPLISVDYDSIDLPGSGAGVVRPLSSGLAAIAFGSFSPENLEQSMWDYVRYGITRSQSELRIVPPHQVLNQWNVMESPERLFTLIPHDRTSFKSSSTGTTSQTDPDFLARGDVASFTRLNEGTPLVPETQTFEKRSPFVNQTYTSALNSPEDVLNSDGDFTLNDGSVRFALEISDDILYTSLQVVRSEEGELDLLAPFDDEHNPQYSGVQYQREICLNYTADALPENDSGASTPWALNSEDPDQVSASAFSGVLTYGTGSGGTKTVYLNNTPLPDAPSLETEASFRLKLLEDATLGTGDSQVRFGLSAPGMTVGIGFVTHSNGERFVEVFDLNNGNVMGRATVDYLDGNYHDYRIVRNPSAGLVDVFIDS